VTAQGIVLFYFIFLFRCRKGGAWENDVMNTNEMLIGKFERREAVIGIIGMGYVGLPEAVAFAEAGFTVVGVDVDDRKVAMLNRGESYVEDVASTSLKALVEAASCGPARITRR
jgi:phosphoglycerate dehydrogenase-like enzyme